MTSIRSFPGPQFGNHEKKPAKSVKLPEGFTIEEKGRKPTYVYENKATVTDKEGNVHPSIEFIKKYILLFQQLGDSMMLRLAHADDIVPPMQKEDFVTELAIRTTQILESMQAVEENKINLH